MNYSIGLLLVCATALADTTSTLSTLQPAAGVDQSLANEAHAAIRRGMDWLIKQQAEDGHWSSADYPALTALPLWAMAKGNAGDLLVTFAVDVPADLDDEQRAAIEALAATMPDNPRADLGV